MRQNELTRKVQKHFTAQYSDELTREDAFYVTNQINDSSDLDLKTADSYDLQQQSMNVCLTKTSVVETLLYGFWEDKTRIG